MSAPQEESSEPVITVPVRVLYGLAETVSTYVNMYDSNVEEVVALFRAARASGATIPDSRADGHK